MPELPEVEVTRRGLAPHARRPHDQRRGGARAAAALAGAARRARARRPHRARDPPARQVPAGRLRRRSPDPAPRHVGQPARAAAGHAGAASTTTSTSCSATACCGCATRAASARCCGPPGDAEAHPLLAHLGVEPLSRALDASAAARAHARAPHGDQAVPDGRPAHRRRRQHLREREPVPRRHQPAQAGAADSSLEQCAASWRRRSRTRCARRSAPAARRCATSSAPTARAGYFQQRYWVYDRAGTEVPALRRADPRASCRGSARPTSALPARSSFDFSLQLSSPPPDGRTSTRRRRASRSRAPASPR